MDRRGFLYTAVGSLLLGPQLLAQSEEASRIAILTGRKSPKLYGVNHKLQKEASDAFEKMRQAALEDGVKLFSVSSHRNFNAQLRIWNSKYDKFRKQGLKGKQIINKIIEYSAFPGASRHHWGTDLDISDLNVLQPADPLNPKHFLKGGIYNKMYAWMQKNASTYGFYEAYTNDKDRKGYKFEPWHYSYKPLSLPMLQEYKAVKFEKHIKSEQIKGHKYIDKAFWEKYKDEYVLGINKALLD
ncbi:MAG TPA: M15 family metallopeptidase [Cytophagales bacterium]|nr:M15 family metallopeptidase [Cytophagales bacterium]